MANEISLTSKIAVSKGGASITNLTSTKSVDMSGVNMSGVVQDVGSGTATSGFEVVEVGDVATGGDYWIQIYNMDSTNFMRVSLTSGAATHFTIPPGAFFGPAKVLASVVPQVNFDTAAGQAFVSSCEA